MEQVYRVLNNGFIRLVDHVGGDPAVLRAARISRRAESRGEESDARLIRFLIERGHGTPFEHAVFTFEVKCPLFVARQWIRHRIASYNEVSLRYCLAEPDYYIPEGLAGEALREYRDAVERAFQAYEELIRLGVPREQARAVLPLAAYTQFYWTINARSLMNFLQQRLDRTAQYEIRQYAEVIYRIFADKMPLTAQAFRENFEKGRSSP